MAAAMSRPLALDPSTALDQPVREVLDGAKATNKPARISIELKLYDPQKRRYAQWTGVNWKIEITTLDQSRKLLRGLDLLLTALQEDGEGTIELLKAAAEKRKGK